MLKEQKENMDWMSKCFSLNTALYIIILDVFQFICSVSVFYDTDLIY